MPLLPLQRPSGAEMRLMRALGGPAYTDTLANRLTVFRARLAVWGAVLYIGAVIFDYASMVVDLATAGMVMLAALLDGLDGRLAKRTGESEFGRYADPSADGYVIFSSYVMAAWYVQGAWWFTVPASGIVVIGLLIFTKRASDRSVRTTSLARVAIFLVFASAVAMEIAIATDRFMYVDFRLFMLWILAVVLGGVLTWVGLAFMLLSLANYHKFGEYHRRGHKVSA